MFPATKPHGSRLGKTVPSMDLLMVSICLSSTQNFEASLNFDEFFSRWFNHLVSIPKLQHNNHWTSGTVRGMRTDEPVFFGDMESCCSNENWKQWHCCAYFIHRSLPSSQFQPFWGRCCRIQLEYPKVLHPIKPRRPNTYRCQNKSLKFRWPKKSRFFCPKETFHLPTVDTKGPGLFQWGYVTIWNNWNNF